MNYPLTEIRIIINTTRNCPYLVSFYFKSQKETELMDTRRKYTPIFLSIPFSSLTGTGERTPKKRKKSQIFVQPSACSSATPAWSSLGCGRGWNKLNFKVPSNPNHFLAPGIPQSCVLSNSSTSKGRDSKLPSAPCRVGFLPLRKLSLHQLTGIFLAGTCSCRFWRAKPFIPPCCRLNCPSEQTGQEPPFAPHLVKSWLFQGLKITWEGKAARGKAQEGTLGFILTPLQIFSHRSAFFKVFFELQGKDVTTLRWPFNKLQSNVN